MEKQKETSGAREQFLVHALSELEKCRERMQGFEDRISAMENRISVMEEHSAENARQVNEIKGATCELLEILNACKGGLKVLGWFGAALKWVGGIAAAIAGIYGLIHIQWGK